MMSLNSEALSASAFCVDKWRDRGSVCESVYVCDRDRGGERGGGEQRGEQIVNT